MSKIVVQESTRKILRYDQLNVGDWFVPVGELATPSTTAVKSSDEINRAVTLEGKHIEVEADARVYKLDIYVSASLSEDD